MQRQLRTGVPDIYRIRKRQSAPTAAAAPTGEAPGAAYPAGAYRELGGGGKLTAAGEEMYTPSSDEDGWDESALAADDVEEEATRRPPPTRRSIDRWCRSHLTRSVRW